MPDTALHAVRIDPDHPTRRTPVWSDEYVRQMRRQMEERHEEQVRRYSERLAVANGAVRMALMALEHGDVARAERELRRAGA